MPDKWYLALLYALDIIACILLIVLILIHAPKGGGMSELFGGGFSSFVGSSIIEKNLNRITVALAIVFGILTVVLFLVS